MNQTELKHFVTEWMLSQDKDMEFAPDENGYVMFRRGACSINIAAYFQMILEDFLEAQALESYKDRWVREVREALKDYVESEGCGCCSNYGKHEEAANKLGELLGFDKYLDDSGYDLTTLPTPPQTKTI